MAAAGANFELIVEPRLRCEMRFFRSHRFQGEPRSGNLEPGDLDRLRSAIAEASSEARNAFFYFALFGLYFIVAVAGTTHEDLLRGSTVAMPGLGVGLPIVGFYALVPLLFILLHLYVLLQVFTLAGLVNFYRLPIASADAMKARFQEPSPSPFLITQWLLAYPPKFVYSIVVWSTLVILPLTFLVAAQLRFLPYHSELITWLHRSYIVIEMVIVLSFWLLIMMYRDRRLADQTAACGRAWRAVYWRLSYPLLAGFGLLTSMFVFLVATVPGDAVERCLLGGSLPVWCSVVHSVRSVLGSVNGEFEIKRSPDGRRMLAITYDLFEAPGTRLGLRRNLVVRYAHLVRSDPAPGTGNSAQQGKALEGSDKRPATSADELARKEQEAWKDRGINLRGRDLRFADLTGSDLRGADLRGADLEGAIVQNARLLAARIRDIPSEELVKECPEDLQTSDGQGKSFCPTRMAGIDLSGSDLRFVEGWKADLRSADLKSTNLEGADLRQSILQGALLTWATLTNAKLQEAHLDLAVLREITAPGVNFEKATLKGAMLRGGDVQNAKVGGADLKSADLGQANLTGATFRLEGTYQQYLAGADVTLAKGFPGFSQSMPNFDFVIPGFDATEHSKLDIENYEFSWILEISKVACESDNPTWAPTGVVRRIWDEYDYAQSHDYLKKRTAQDLIYLLAGLLLYDGPGQKCQNTKRLNNHSICLLHKIRSLWEMGIPDRRARFGQLRGHWSKDHPEILDGDKSLLFNSTIQLASQQAMRACETVVLDHEPISSSS
jgi:uncharacterized protein YjbI with pentapeptide repeats